MTTRFSLFALLVLVSAVFAPAHAESIWVLTSNDGLLNFDSATPAQCTSGIITGLSAGELVVGIDFRPASPYGRLYAITDQGRMYVLSNPATGVATLVGAGGLPTANLAYGMDFNPVVDRIRAVGEDDKNFRANPDTGILTATDVNVAYASGDPHFGADPHVTATAYSNDFVGAQVTTLYVIDSGLDILAIQTPANGGVLHTVGPLGVNASAANGFDISGVTHDAYAAFNVNLPPITPILYRINLSTGLASAVGAIGCGGMVAGLSVVTTEVTSVTPLGMVSLSLQAVPTLATTSTRLTFGDALPERARLTIYDIQGRTVRSYDLDAGQQEQPWDLMDAGGGRVASGLYFARLVARHPVAPARIVVIP